MNKSDKALGVYMRECYPDFNIGDIFFLTDKDLYLVTNKNGNDERGFQKIENGVRDVAKCLDPINLCQLFIEAYDALIKGQCVDKTEEFRRLGYA